MDIKQVLSQIELFSGLNEEQITSLVDLVQVYDVNQGDVISRQADIGEHLYILLEGEAIVHRIDEQGFRKPITLFEPGKIYGVTALFLDAPRDATVTMASAGQIGIIERQAFEALLDTRPDIDRKLLLPDELIDQLNAPEYDWLADGEVVLYVGHRHWMVFVGRLLRGLFWLAIYAGVAFGTLFLLPTLTLRQLLLPGLIIYVLTLVFKYIDWRDDVLIATTRRISHRERIALLYETLQEAPLDRIQNINVNYHFPGSLFGYGDVTFATAAQVGTLVFSGLPKPEQVREVIFQQLEDLRASRKASQQDVIRQELTNRLVSESEIDESSEEIPLPETQVSALPIERPADTSPFVESTSDESATPPSGLSRTVGWLTKQGFIPRSRFEENGTVTWRKHWLFLLSNMLRPLVLTAALIFLTVLAYRGIPDIIIEMFPGYAIVLTIVAILSLGWFWWTANDWANDLYIITADRIIDVERRPLSLSLERREASLGMIQNVSLNVGNVFAAVFNFGDVIIQTAGAGDFTFRRVADPRRVQREVFDYLEAFREKQRQQDAAQRRSELSEWLTVYDQMRRPEQNNDASENESKPGI